MPFKSQSQARFFFSAAKKKNGLEGLDAPTAQKFIEDTNHQKIGELPQKVGKLRFRHIKQLTRTK